MIPEAAVEAAAEWVPHSGDCEVRPERDCTCWKARVDLMRAALEAAAPHMLADVWQAGHSAGDGDQSAMWDARNSGKPVKYADVVTPNPYRPTP